VVVIVTAEGVHWFGLLAGDADYDLILAWARDCLAQGAPTALPGPLDSHRLRRF
jgi:hypothetical protein